MNGFNGSRLRLVNSARLVLLTGKPGGSTCSPNRPAAADRGTAGPVVAEGARFASWAGLGIVRKDERPGVGDRPGIDADRTAGGDVGLRRPAEAREVNDIRVVRVKVIATS